MAMVSSYAWKARLSHVLRPWLNPLVKIGVRANHITLLGCVMSLIFGACLWLRPDLAWLPGLFPAVLLVRMCLNNIDGVMARDFGQKTVLGGYLNELCDVVSDAAMYLPLAALSGFSPVLVVLWVVLAIISEFAGVLAIPAGKDRCYAPPLTKSDRAIVVGIVGLAYACGLRQPLVLRWILAGLCMLSTIAIVNRVRCGVK